MKGYLDPAERLEMEFEKNGYWHSYNDRKAFLLCMYKGTDGQQYSSYKYVSESELKERKYEIRYADSGLVIVFKDVLYDPATRTYVLPSSNG